jgi:hypothetical protein
MSLLRFAQICSVHIIWHVIKQHITCCLQHKSWISCNRIPLYAIFFLYTGSYNLNIVFLRRKSSSERRFSAGSPRTTVGPQILGVSLSLSLSHTPTHVYIYIYGPIVTAINSVILQLATFFSFRFNVYIACYIIAPSLWRRSLVWRYSSEFLPWQPMASCQ